MYGVFVGDVWELYVLQGYGWCKTPDLLPYELTARDKTEIVMEGL